MAVRIRLPLVLLCVVLVFVITIFAILVTPSTTPEPPPAPPAPPPAKCDWCDDLLSRFDGAATARASHCTHLSGSDFTVGTYVIDEEDTCYVLDEDIVFHPSPGTDFRATNAPYATDPTFVLDFPTAILVRAAGVTIDLSGHEIRQSLAHNVQQRFFAMIELTTPFIDGQGPADFVDTEPTPAARFTLRNGRIGLSSHHGVHGNGAWSVLIQDVDIVDYDVGAIALNGMHDVVLQRVRALGTAKKVPVLGTYSSARFLTPFVDKALAAAAASAPFVTHAATMRLGNASLHLKTLMGQVLSDVSATGAISSSTHPEAYALFADTTGLPDGSASYGIVLHAHGVAVNGFECDRSDARHDQMHHILITDCVIKDTLLHTIEVPVLQEVATSKLQRGPAGDVLRVADLVGVGGAYSGTALSETKVALQELVRLMSGTGFGTLAVHPTIVSWARGTTGALATAVQSGDFKYMRNGDNMFHVNKGAFGIRIGGGHHIAVLRTVIDGVVSTGDTTNMDPLPGETADDAYWTGGHDGGHPAAAPQHGYGGADAVGIAIAASSNVFLGATIVRNVHSRVGWSSAISVFNDAADTHIQDAGIFNITTHPDPSVKVRGPKQPRAVGVVVTTDAQPPTYSGAFDIENVKAGRIGMACNTLLENTGIDGCAAPETNFYTL